MLDFTKYDQTDIVIVMPELWASFQDILNYYMLDQLERRSGQVELAALLGMTSRSTINGAFRGKKKFSFDHLDSLSKKANISRSDILRHLLNIALDIEAKKITRERLKARIAAASQRGRRKAEELTERAAGEFEFEHQKPKTKTKKNAAGREIRKSR